MARQTRKQKIVLASGVFDLLHLGHVRFLEDAKKAGGKNAKLVVIIASDTTVEEMKGRKPIMSEDQRCTLVESLRVVDKAVLGFKQLDIGEVIEEIKPNIIALGYDQEEMEKDVKTYVEKSKLPIKIIRIAKFEADNLDSSSKIKQKIVEKFSN